MSFDVFGREKEMDLGQPSGGGRPDPVPAGDGPAGGGGPYVPGRLALGLFTLLVLAAGAFMFVTVEGNAVDDPVKQAERGEVDATSELSLTREPNLRRAIAALDGDLRDGGFIDSFRVAPDRVNAIVVQPSGKRETIAINVAFETTSSDAGTGEGEGLQSNDIDPAAPQRIIRAAREKFDLRAKNFDYMVANEPRGEGEQPTWTAFWKLPLKDNDVAAAGDGTDVRRLGTPDAKTRAQNEAARERAERAQRAAAARSQCLSRATSTAEIQRCLR